MSVSLIALIITWRECTGRTAFVLAAVIGGVSISSGCTTISTKGHTQSVECASYDCRSKWESAARGVTYYLPMRRLSLTVSRKLQTPKELDVALEDAKEDLAKRREQLAIAKEQVQSSQQLLSRLREDSDAKAKETIRKTYRKALAEQRKVAGAVQRVRTKIDKLKDTIRLSQSRLSRFSEAIEYELSDIKSKMKKVSRNISKIEAQLSNLKDNDELDYETKKKQSKGLRDAISRLQERDAQLSARREELRAVRDEIVRSVQGITGQERSDMVKRLETCPVPTYNVQFSMEAMEPDKSIAYRAILSHNWFRDDDVEIKVNDRGLLSSSEVTASGKAGDVVAEIAKTIAFFVGPSVPDTAPGVSLQDALDGERDRVMELCPSASLREFSHKTIFDPTDRVSLNNVNTFLARKSVPYRVVVDRKSGTSLSECVSSIGECSDLSGRRYSMSYFKSGGRSKNVPNELPSVRSNWAQGTTQEEFPDNFGGLLYRTLLPHRLEIVRIRSKSKVGPSIAPHVADTGLVYLPNRSPIAVAPMRSGLFVESKYDLKFKNGVIASWGAERPSEALEVVRLPLSIVNGVFDALSKLIPFRVEQVKDQTDLLNAQKSLIEAQQELEATVE